jgi:hypothetical protein
MEIIEQLREQVTDDMLAAGGRAADAQNIRWSTYRQLEEIYVAMAALAKDRLSALPPQGSGDA